MRWFLFISIFFFFHQSWAQTDQVGQHQHSSPISLHCSVCNTHLGYLGVEDVDLDLFYFHIQAQQLGFLDTTYFCTKCETVLFAYEDVIHRDQEWVHFDEASDRRQLEIINLNNPPEEQFSCGVCRKHEDMLSAPLLEIDIKRLGKLFK